MTVNDFASRRQGEDGFAALPVLHKVYEEKLGHKISLRLGRAVYPRSVFCRDQERGQATLPNLRD